MATKNIKNQAKSNNFKPKREFYQYGVTVEIDPFLCKCGPCKSFWKHFGKDASSLLESEPLSRAAATSTLYRSNKLVKPGERVWVWGKYKGTVKYVGPLQDDLMAPEVYIGVHLDDMINSITNGIYNGKRYFFAPPGHGAFVHYKDISPLHPIPPPNHPPIYGNEMFPSFGEIKRARKKRAELDPEFDIGRPSSKTISKTAEVAANKKFMRIKHTHHDPNDIAFKDELKRLSVVPKPKSPPPDPETVKKNEMDNKMRKWKEEFGNDKRAARMANTVRKLHFAYEEGERLKRKEEQGSDASDSDTDSDAS